MDSVFFSWPKMNVIIQTGWSNMKIIQTETNIGLIRKNNEDVSLVVEHPKDKNILLLLVADGMGGKEHGEVAAAYTAHAIEKWFKGKTIASLKKLDKLEDQLTNIIEKTSNEIIEKLGRNVSGTTLSMAIVTEEGTLVANVGDSRIYVYRNRNLVQISEDASDVWYYYKFGAVKKDDLRYFFNNNIITSCIGLDPEICDVETQIIENDYDILLLLTDGVTDLITDKKIKKLIESNRKEQILSKIIYEAVYVDQNLHIPMRLRRKKYSKYILPFHGRDNASGSIYIRK